MFVKELPYKKDSIHYFLPFWSQIGAVWIDSCRAQQNRGRFDIISAEPTHVLSVKNRRTYLDNQPIDSNIFQAMLLQLQAHHTQSTDIDTPFCAGIIGYLGYDIAWQLEHLPRYQEYDVGLDDAHVGYYPWSIVTDHLKKQTYLFATEQVYISNVLSNLQQPSQKIPSFYLHRPFTSNMSFHEYQTSFDRLKKHLFDGNCYQANLCQRFSSRYSGEPFDAYQTLRNISSAPFSAYLRTPKGALLSCSPERFVRVKDRHVQTQPIKGTMPRFNDPEQDRYSATTLLNSEKDFAENIMIVDLMRNDISQTCLPGTVNVPEICKLKSFSNVHHLVSTVTGTLDKQYHPVELLQRCFPGGSITGAPKISAMKILSQLEKHHRSAYCGSIFYCDTQGNMDSSILIRTVLCSCDKVYIYAGGGIVADSEVQAEFDECFAKITNLTQHLESKHAIDQATRSELL